MNKTLESFARDKIKEGLASLEEKHRELFKLTYAGPTDPEKRTPAVIAEIKAANIDDVVDGIPEDRLSIALDQVEATIEKTKIDT